MLEDAVLILSRRLLSLSLLAGRTVNYIVKGWFNVVVWLISSTVGGNLNIIFPLLLLQIVKLTCTLDFDLNCIVSASRLDTQSGSEI